MFAYMYTYLLMALLQQLISTDIKLRKEKKKTK